MDRTIEISLNTASVKNAIASIKYYRDGLASKTEEFVARLLDVGIERADSVPGISGTTGSHGFEQYVWYAKEVEPKKYGCHGIMFGGGRDIDVTWGLDGEKMGSINTMLALEFGTAGAALPPQEAFGSYGGQGTNSYNGHADDLVWYFAIGRDKKGKPIWKKASAITPTRPMFEAAQEMLEQYYTVAREVFSE